MRSNTNINIRTALAKTTQSRRQPAIRKTRLRHHGKRSHPAPQARALPTQRVKRARNRRVIPFPVRRESDSGRTADKQRHSQIILKMPDVLTHGRLRHAQLLPCPGETAQPGRCFKGRQRIQRWILYHKKNLSRPTGNLVCAAAAFAACCFSAPSGRKANSKTTTNANDARPAPVWRFPCGMCFYYCCPCLC